MEKDKEVKKPTAKKWVATIEFRDSSDFNKVYKVGEEVEYTAKREELKLIELK